MRKRAETDRDGEKDHGVFIGNLAEAGHGDPRLNLKARRQSSPKGMYPTVDLSSSSMCLNPLIRTIARVKREYKASTHPHSRSIADML